MILGSKRENIFVLKIESLINNFSFVTESVVVERKGKLVALVHFNIDENRRKNFKTSKDDVHNC